MFVDKLPVEVQHSAVEVAAAAAKNENGVESCVEYVMPGVRANGDFGSFKFPEYKVFTFLKLTKQPVLIPVTFYPFTRNVSGCP